eukprot:2073811-Rhodomonas_salina.1
MRERGREGERERGREANALLFPLSSSLLLLPSFLFLFPSSFLPLPFAFFPSPFFLQSARHMHAVRSSWK